MFTSAYLSFYGQSSCSNAINIQHETDTVFHVNDSVLWLSFIADTSTIYVNSIIQNSQINQEISLFNSNCSNLMQLENQEGNYLNYENLTTNSSYLIKISFGGVITDSIFFSGSKDQVLIPDFKIFKDTICLGDSIEIFDLSHDNSLKYDSSYIFVYEYGNGMPKDSTLYQTFPNPFSFHVTFPNAGEYYISLIIYIWDTVNNNWAPNPFYTSDYLTKYDTIWVTVIDTIGSIKINLSDKLNCDTVFYASDSSENIMSAFNHLGHAAGLSWKLYDISTGLDYPFISNPEDTINIFMPPGFNNPLNPGNYALTVSGMSYCGRIYTDSVNFTITANPKIIAPDVLCPGDTVMIIGQSNCGQFWNWNLGDGTTLSGNDTIYHVYNQIGNKLISLEVDNFSGKVYHQIHVTQPIKPIIKGNRSACNTTANYSIENYDSNYTYTWSTKVYDDLTNSYSTGNFTINGTSNVVTADNISIDWNSSTFPNLPNYVVIEVIAKLDETNCSESNTHNVYECCEADIGEDAIDWNDTIINDNFSISLAAASISGIVIIKDSVIIDRSTIYFGPQAKLILDSNAYLKITNATLTKGTCDYMWDGIYTYDESNTISVKNSTIKYSINGLVSENGGPIFANDIYFLNNYISIQVLNHKKDFIPNPPPFNPIQFSATNLAIIAQTLTYPYIFKQAFSGMVISNVEGIQIGDTLDLSQQNYFENLRNGIRIYNSKVNIYNNTFNEIANLTAQTTVFDQGAINISSPEINDLVNIADVKIGHNGYYTNNFDSCEYDIVSNNSMLLIENNIFNSSRHSITVYNFKNGTNIRNNTFKDVEMGIKVQNLTNIIKKININDNYFGGQGDNSYSSLTRKAIDIINCNAQPNTSIKPHIHNNTIKYSGIRNFISHGIRIQNCDGIKVNSNEIKRIASSSIINSDWDKVMGIRVSTSNAAQIADNFIYGFGQGISTYGNLTTTQFSCNEIWLYKYGFYWGYNTALSNQGFKGPFIPNWNTHNEWNTIGSINPNEKLATGTIANNLVHPGDIKWYYFSNFGAAWEPNSVYNQLNPIMQKITPTTNDNALHFCGLYGGNSSTLGGNFALIDDIRDEEVRDWLYEEMMQGIEYEELMEEYRAYDAEFLFDMLRYDTTMMWLGGDMDADYREYFDSLHYSNVGAFAEVLDLINDGYIDDAIILNNEIVAESDIYANLQTVLDIYLNSWCKERYILTMQEYNTLFNIANQTPNEAGDAVFTARIMIGYEVDEQEVPYLFEQNKNSEIEEVKFKLYPNPASDKVTIEFLNDELELLDVKLNIYTITGILVYSKEFITEYLYEEFSISNLNNGVYFYKIEFSNGNKNSGKLIILKE